MVAISKQHPTCSHRRGPRGNVTTNKAGLCHRGSSRHTSQRYVLPKDLPNAVKHLTDRELDLLIAASIDEAKRRGRLLPSVQANAPDGSIPKRSPSKDKRQAEIGDSLVDTWAGQCRSSSFQGWHNAVTHRTAIWLIPIRCAKGAGVRHRDAKGNVCRQPSDREDRARSERQRQGSSAFWRRQ